jgi:hypothetical protein
VNTASEDLRYERWVAQLEQIIKQVYAAHRDRYLWRGLAEITQSANLPASVIFDALGLWYGDSQAAAVRRQLDRTRGTVSLARLLEDIARHPEVMTRERHLAVWADPQWTKEAQTNFDKFAVNRNADRIDVRAVRRDMARLDAVGAVVKGHVDENVAHTALQPVSSLVTYADLNASMDEIGYLVKKYTSLLKAEIIWQLEPVIQGDWRAPFRQPWITEERDWTEPS